MRDMYNQMQQYFDKMLSKYQSGFWRGYDSQHSLITVIRKWHESVAKGSAFGALLDDLLKDFEAFNC